MGRGSGAARKVTPRAERFLIQPPLVYRRDGGLVWYDGKIENVSPTGVLFHGEKPLGLGDVMQISFSLPPAEGVGEPTEVFCWARVIRIRLPNDFETNHTLAVKVLRYRSQPRQLADVRAATGEVRGPTSVRKPQPDSRDLEEEKHAA